MENFNLNYLNNIRKSSRKIIKNKYLTYFVALFTIFFVSESLINSDNITFVKLVFQNNLLKVLIFSFICIIGYFNITLGLLLLINFIFVINVPQRVEGFANSLPNLIDKNEILKYQKNFISTEPKKLKYKSNDEIAKNINDKKTKVPKEKTEPKNSDSNEKKETKNTKDTKDIKETQPNNKSSKYLKNPIKLRESEKIEEIADKMKNKSNDNNSDIDEEDEYESKISKKKNKLRNELEQLEKEEQEIVESEDDGTIKNDIKKKNLDKRLKLQAMREEEEESSSESSNSSGSSSSSSDSSDSDREYNEVSINEARDHVMKKLRNKLKKKYIKGK